MTERIYETQSGNIYYWTNDIKPDRITLSIQRQIQCLCVGCTGTWKIETV